MHPLRALLKKEVKSEIESREHEKRHPAKPVIARKYSFEGNRPELKKGYFFPKGRFHLGGRTNLNQKKNSGAKKSHRGGRKSILGIRNKKQKDRGNNKVRLIPY